jgi:NAD(P)-dependent dehydrogenase (short-subunit alcohol dehydrogenase family)
MKQLEGKVAVVTGVGRPLGIGRACALKLAEMGADVMISDICRKYEGGTWRSTTWANGSSCRRQLRRLRRRVAGQGHSRWM